MFRFLQNFNGMITMKQV